MSGSESDEDVESWAVLRRKTVGEERNILAKQVCWQIIERDPLKKTFDILFHMLKILSILWTN